jgi:hypothetical protein
MFPSAIFGAAPFGLPFSGPAAPPPPPAPWLIRGYVGARPAGDTDPFGVDPGRAAGSGGYVGAVAAPAGGPDLFGLGG